ncbi:hypothetical protein [Schlesneria sp.]|uniref:hypothetical protein n=1 Tax=Schlesneria sp. TaxID=2762018 RepID=UPI002F1B142F
MTSPEHNVADALRVVALRLEEALERGRRSKDFDANDLLQTLLAVADCLDPQTTDAEARPETLPY